MIILAFDIISPSPTLAIFKDGEPLCYKTIEQNTKHSELLISSIENLLNSANIWYQDLDLVLATITPGSFTSSRIALIVAKTIKMSLNIDVLLLDSTQILAYKNSTHYKGDLLVIMDAGMSEYYMSAYNSSNGNIKLISDLKIWKIDDLSSYMRDNIKSKKLLVCGLAKNDLIKINDVMSNNILYYGDDIINASDVIKFFTNSSKNDIFLQNVEIPYLRQPIIEKRKK